MTSGASFRARKDPQSAIALAVVLLAFVSFDLCDERFPVGPNPKDQSR
jgi:hypothetical protein